MLHKANMERYLARSELHLHLTGLQTVRSALISYGPSFLATLFFISAWVVLGGGPAFFRYRVWEIFLVPVMISAALEWCRSRVRVFIDEGRLRVTAPLLGDIAFELDNFQDAAVVAPDVPPWAREVLLFLIAGLLLILEAYRFFSGLAVDPVVILFAVMALVFAFRGHQQRDYKVLEIRFGVHTDWRRHVWSQRKVTFRGREEVLQELKRQVEAAAGQAGE